MEGNGGTEGEMSTGGIESERKWSGICYPSDAFKDDERAAATQNRTGNEGKEQGPGDDS